MSKVDGQLINRYRQVEPHATTEIVMQAALNMGVHYSTVQRYLRGEVKKATFAKKLLDTILNLLREQGINIEEGSETKPDN